MTNSELFYKKIKDEFFDFMEEIGEWTTDNLIKNAEFISSYKQIYEYLMRDKPINEKSNVDHFLKMHRPLYTICESFQEEKPPVYDLVNPTIWKIGNCKIFDKNFSSVKADFLQRIKENYMELVPDESHRNVYSDIHMMHEYIKHHIIKAKDEDIMTLMQFENPLKVMVETAKVDGQFETKFAATAHQVRFSDVLTMPYFLDTERILPETKYRHGAIDSLINIIPKPDFTTSMLWIDFHREMADICPESLDEKTNPYNSFIEALCTISQEQGSEILQQIYELAWEKCILENEMIEAAKYLEDGGDIAKVHKLSACGYFDCPYEDNLSSAEAFLSQQEEEKNIMLMM